MKYIIINTRANTNKMFVCFPLPGAHTVRFGVHTGRFGVYTVRLGVHMVRLVNKSEDSPGDQCRFLRHCIFITVE